MSLIIDMIAQMVSWKDQNPDLKVLLAVGGWNLGSGPFTSMVSTQAARKTFIDHSIGHLRDRGRGFSPNIVSVL